VKKIYGSYNTLKEARDAVKDLADKGYNKEQITVISAEELDGDLEYMETEKNEYNSIWDTIKDTFTFERYTRDYWNLDPGNSKIELEDYRTNLDRGDIVVLVDEKR
jgi:hypothetical protein